MELSIVRIHKAPAASEQQWSQIRPVLHSYAYLSQCPFIRLDEESHPAHGEFSLHRQLGAMDVTLVTRGSADVGDSSGTNRQLLQGDADLYAGAGDLAQGRAGEQGVRLLRLRINLPARLETTNARHEVVRPADALHASFGNASARLYAGSLGTRSEPRAAHWPLTMADVTIDTRTQSSLPLASTERSFVYISSGDVELGRNRVRLGRGSVAWIERTTRPGAINPLTLRAVKKTRLLLFSSAALDDESAFDSGCGGSRAQSLAKATLRTTEVQT